MAHITFTTSDNNDTYGANALPVITGDIIVIGNGATMERDVNTPDFRFFCVEIKYPDHIL